MVEVATTLSLRKQRQNARLKVINDARPKGGIRVEPRDDTIRRLVKHPNGMKFRSEGSVEWPNDRFTKRRIAEGVVTVEEKKQEQPEPQDQNEPERLEPQQQDPNSAA
jgi:hypothetical protein